MKPVLILDCDNVLLDFAAPFRDWLRGRGVDFRIESFALAANMRHIADGRPVSEAEFPELLHGFFAEGQPTQNPLPGAVAAVHRLSQDMEVIILSNIPAEWRAQREEHLRRLGFAVDVVSNHGPKGAKVRLLADGRPAVFVDDLTGNLESAAIEAPAVGRLQMVGEAMLRGFVGVSPAAEARKDEWSAAEPWIRQRLERETQ